MENNLEKFGFIYCTHSIKSCKRDDQMVISLKNMTYQVQSLFLAGERADPDTVSWLENKLKIPIVDHCGKLKQIAYCCKSMGIEALPIKKGSPTVAMPGYNIDVLSEDNIEVERGSLGAISIKLPLPPVLCHIMECR